LAPWLQPGDRGNAPANPAVSTAFLYVAFRFAKDWGALQVASKRLVFPSFRGDSFIMEIVFSVTQEGDGG
jgi:hypothetical protein